MIDKNSSIRRVKESMAAEVCDEPLTSGSHFGNPVLVIGSATCRAAALCLLLSHVYDMVPAPDTNLKSWYINKKKMSKWQLAA